MGNPVEKVLWSIAFPGFGQILNGQLLKGTVFLGLEFIINVNSNLNQVIMLSFIGDTASAIKETNYQWIMFYPCIYTFAIWDAYRNAAEQVSRFSFLPLVFSAYIGTLGVVFSPVFIAGGFMPGPILLGLSCMAVGALLGWLLQFALAQRTL